MKKLTLLAASSLLAITALPGLASANCPNVNSGSATVSCEQGVQVIRQSPRALPRISPDTAAQIKMQRERVAAERRAQIERARIERERLKLEQQRINNESYLYRDTNSPLRSRRVARGVVVVGNGG